MTGNVRRLFPRRDLLHLDPFARFEELFMQPPAGLPPHEHRGFESVTLVLEGALEHSESRSGTLVARVGDVIRLTAGRGCYHAERPPEPGQTHALQLWVALARADKGCPPEVQRVASAEVPERREKALRRRVVLGPGGAVILRTEVTWIDLLFSGGKTLHTEPIPEGHGGFLYVTHGRAQVEGHEITPGEALLFTDAPSLTLRARKEARCALLYAPPRGEPIRPWGTVVD